MRDRSRVTTPTMSAKTINSPSPLSSSRSRRSAGSSPRASITPPLNFTLYGAPAPISSHRPVKNAVKRTPTTPTTTPCSTPKHVVPPLDLSSLEDTVGVDKKPTTPTTTPTTTTYNAVAPFDFSSLAQKVAAYVDKTTTMPVPPLDLSSLEQADDVDVMVEGDMNGESNRSFMTNTESISIVLSRNCSITTSESETFSESTEVTTESETTVGEFSSEAVGASESSSSEPVRSSETASSEAVGSSETVSSEHSGSISVLARAAPRSSRSSRSFVTLTDYSCSSLPDDDDDDDVTLQDVATPHRRHFLLERLESGYYSPDVGDVRLSVSEVLEAAEYAHRLASILDRVLSEVEPVKQEKCLYQDEHAMKQFLENVGRHPVFNSQNVYQKVKYFEEGKEVKSVPSPPPMPTKLQANRLADMADRTVPDCPAPVSKSHLHDSCSCCPRLQFSPEVLQRQRALLKTPRQLRQPPDDVQRDLCDILKTVIGRRRDGVMPFEEVVCGSVRSDWSTGDG